MASFVRRGRYVAQVRRVVSSRAEPTQTNTKPDGLSCPGTTPPILPPDAASAAAGTLVTGGSRLSEGAIILITLRARVLGINLLRLEATIEATPARLKQVNRLLPSPSSSARVRAQTLARQAPRARREHTPEARLRQARVIGSRLNEALRLLAEGSASLAATTEHRSSPAHQARTLR